MPYRTTPLLPPPPSDSAATQPYLPAVLPALLAPTEPTEAELADAEARLSATERSHRCTLPARRKSTRDSQTPTVRPGAES